jgi:hypothetical protein
LNIIEAINSGKRIKRKGWPEFQHYENHYQARHTGWEDIVAQDWEIEEPAISVTRSQVIEAWVRALKTWGARREYSDGSITPIEELLKELGFTE